jgi:hypothetical protein
MDIGENRKVAELKNDFRKSFGLNMPATWLPVSTSAHLVGFVAFKPRIMQFLKKEFLDGGLGLLQAQKGKICVSIIVPVHRFPAQSGIDRLAVKSAFLRARLDLLDRYPYRKVRSYLAALDVLCGQADLTHKEEGLGFFLSTGIRLVVPFTFPVTKKVFVGDRFLTRDVLFQQSYAFPYYVLNLTEGKAELFQGKMEQLAEVKDEHFPFADTSDYEYSRPARGSSCTGHAVLKAFEKDPSIIREIREQSFLKHVDQRFHHYQVDSLPLVVCGELKDVAYFKGITKYDKVISCYLVGNYRHLKRKQLGDLVWPAVKTDLNEKSCLLIDELKEKAGTGLTETGIVPVWQAVKEGRAFRLLVEKDYSVPGYLGGGGDCLYPVPPPVPYTVLPDAVEEVINSVLEQGGEVVFVENGRLQDVQHIALFTRY